MIAIEMVLQWLNWEYPSEISDTSRYWIGRMMDPGLPDDERKATMIDLTNVVLRLHNPLEQAEILANCGGAGYQLGEIDDPAVWMAKAAEIYEYCADSHRYATALWMLYILQRGRGKYRQAFDIANKARRLFIKQMEKRQKKVDAQAESWYRGRIVDMTVDLISSPEDMFECLFEFQGSNLSPSAMEIRNRISVQVEKKDFIKTQQEMELLRGISLRSPQPEEAAEALAFCGVVYWVLEEKKQAISHFRSALSQYLPASFEYAVLQWMLGLGLLNFRADVFRAIDLMESAIESFDRLRVKAIHENHLDRCEWFANHHVAMKRVLRKMVEET